MRANINKHTTNTVFRQGGIIEFEFDGESWNVDPKYDIYDCVNDLHPANLFSFPIPEDMTYEDKPIKFEICLK